MDPREPVPLYSHVDEIGVHFISLEQALSKSSTFAAQVRPENIRDEFDRFRLWAGNIAAHRKGRRSLEYRLRDSALLRDEAHSLLTALHNTLQTSLDIVEGDRIPWDQLSASESDSEFDGALEEEEFHSDTELKQMLNSCKSTITCLFRLSMSIRDPAPNDQSRTLIRADKSYFEEYDVLHAKAKYPNCSKFLVERLGRANSGRRQYLTYRDEHHQKLAKDADLIGLETTKTENTGASTEATIVSKNDLEVIDGDDDALSLTSYATSVNTAIRVPCLPKEARENEHWECPICFMIVSIHTRANWKQHVYRDLHSYCCTFRDCATADRLYDSRRAWFTHELEAHRTSWQCIESCNRMFTAEEDFDRHVEMSHPDLSQSRVVSALKRTAAKRPSLSDDACCPLCNQQMPLRSLQRHLARHQEQLALFALPSFPEDSEEDFEEEDQGTDMRVSPDEELSDMSDTSDVHDATGEEQPRWDESSSENRENVAEVSGTEALEGKTRVQTEADVVNVATKNVVGALDTASTVDPELIATITAEVKESVLQDVQLRSETQLDTTGEGQPSLAQNKKIHHAQVVIEERSRRTVDPELIKQITAQVKASVLRGLKSSKLDVTGSASPASAEDVQEDTQDMPNSKGILRKPTGAFPEDPQFFRAGVAPHRNSLKGKEIPPGSRWTRIDRRVVNPEALEEAKERFEERMDCVIVLRVLSKAEIQKLAYRTKEIRESRENRVDSIRPEPANTVDEGAMKSPAPMPTPPVQSGGYARPPVDHPGPHAETTSQSHTSSGYIAPTQQEIDTRPGSKGIDAQSDSEFEDIYSYTDAAGMYRDTGPVWRTRVWRTREAEPIEKPVRARSYSLDAASTGASSPPAAVPAFGILKEWRNLALDTEPPPLAQSPKPAVKATESATISASDEINDVAIEPPGSDASFTVRTGYPETPISDNTPNVTQPASHEADAKISAAGSSRVGRQQGPTEAQNVQDDSQLRPQYQPRASLGGESKPVMVVGNGPETQRSTRGAWADGYYK
ncbi:hypothetical protein K491DRAFT_332872 [Lophiostoma macrostomum CBS 122681]|uniref:C2H2-type domain-containing protein n=1 Tax=Lophiostoma macrostomum CBS 122681 TaxID=1314788 RepID=A0A6A6TSJ3_9PLEO|nr:hypothetical protein K491DRAFT_332872 [Lophiostoma macrostomum CBS 122681]